MNTIMSLPTAIEELTSQLKPGQTITAIQYEDGSGLNYNVQINNSPDWKFMSVSALSAYVPLMLGTSRPFKLKQTPGSNIVIVYYNSGASISIYLTKNNTIQCDGNFMGIDLNGFKAFADVATQYLLENIK